MNMLSSAAKSVLVFSTGAVAVLVIAYLVLMALRGRSRGDKDLTLRVVSTGIALIAALVGATSSALSIGSSLYIDPKNLLTWMGRFLTDYQFILAVVTTSIAALSGAWVSFSLARRAKRDDGVSSP